MDYLFSYQYFVSVSHYISLSMCYSLSLSLVSHSFLPSFSLFSFFLFLRACMHVFTYVSICTYICTVSPISYFRIRYCSELIIYKCLESYIKFTNLLLAQTRSQGQKTTYCWCPWESHRRGSSCGWRRLIRKGIQSLDKKACVLKQNGRPFNNKKIIKVNNARTWVCIHIHIILAAMDQWLRH